MNSSGVENINVGRSRVKLLFLLILVIVSGLASRKFPVLFPEVFGTSIGDVLWALMVFLCWAFLIPLSSTAKIATLALISAYCVEFSQLYQEPWLNEVRHTAIGHLVLGSTFWWPDLVAYLIGVAGGAALDKLLLSRIVDTSRTG